MEDHLAPLTQPMIDHEANPKDDETQESASPVTFVVVLATLIALCGSLCIGCITGYSSPTQAEIMKDLDLSIADYSMFGSMVKGGGIIGALLNGKLADAIGRKATMKVSAISCIVGWTLIALGKVFFSSSSEK